LGSELAMESVALRAPVANGVKVTCAVQPWLGVRVVVEQGEVTAKSAALGPVMEVTIPVTEAEPVLRRVMVRIAGEAMSMLPKASAPGVIWSCARTAVPVSETVRERVVALVERLRVPVRVPAMVGVKVTCKVQLAAAARVEPVAGHVPLDAA